MGTAIRVLVCSTLGALLAGCSPGHCPTEVFLTTESVEIDGESIDSDDWPEIWRESVYIEGSLAVYVVVDGCRSLALHGESWTARASTTGESCI